MIDFGSELCFFIIKLHLAIYTYESILAFEEVKSLIHIMFDNIFRNLRIDYEPCLKLTLRLPWKYSYTPVVIIIIIFIGAANFDAILE